MHQVYNFNAGPGMLPVEVMQQAKAEFIDWHGTGMSIMELGHRGAAFKQVAEQAEQDLRDLMGVPPHYQILFLPGGASTQFAMVPLNLMRQHRKADYILTGNWSKKAIEEAKRYGDVNIAAHVLHQESLVCIPHQRAWTLSADADYVHYTPNETIDGIEFNWVPETGQVPLVADMSSMILSRPVDVSQYGLIYAGAQKNMGQAGVTVVVIRNDLVTKLLPGMPTLYAYQTHVTHHSFYNTPPTYSWYLAGLVLAWLKKQGGVQVIYAINQRKAQTLYDFIDQQAGFYVNRIHPDCRSLMNVVFHLRNEALTDLFLAEAEQAGLMNLKGHRIAGGVRASLYNAMPQAGVDALVSFMQTFANQHG